MDESQDNNSSDEFHDNNSNSSDEFHDNNSSDEFHDNNPSNEYVIKKKLLKLVNIMPKFIEICVNSCIAFTGQFVNNTSCHFCKELRYINNNLQKKKPRKVLSYFSLIDRFKIQYNNPKRSQLLRY